MNFLDELLALLPDVNLWLCCLCQHSDGWGAMLADSKPNPATYSGKGATPADAMRAALAAAGVQIDD